MLGTSFTTANISTWTAVGELPDVSSNVVTLPLVNQDGYGSEYRKYGAHLNHTLKIRSSNESPRKDGTQYMRHNLEFTAVPNNPTDVALYGFDYPLIVSVTVRRPFRSTPDGTKLAGAMVGSLTSKFSVSSGGFLLPVFNFES